MNISFTLLSGQGDDSIRYSVITFVNVMNSLVNGDVLAYNAMMAAHARVKNWKGARSQTELMPNACARTYTVIADCYSAAQKTDKPKELLKEIKQRPDSQQLLNDNHILIPLIKAFFSSGADVEKLRAKITSNTIAAIALVTHYGKYRVPVPNPEELLKVIKERKISNPADSVQLKKLTKAFSDACKKTKKYPKIQEELGGLLNESDQKLIEETVPGTGIYSVKLHEHTAIPNPSIRDKAWPEEMRVFVNNLLSTRNLQYLAVDVGGDKRADMLRESLQNYISKEYADKFSCQINESGKVEVRSLLPNDSLTAVNNNQNTNSSTLDLGLNDTTSETSNLSDKTRGDLDGFKYYQPINNNNSANLAQRRQSI